MFFSGKNLAVAAAHAGWRRLRPGVGFAKAEGAKLPAFNAPITETSISGISSGAFMSVQFGVAWSSVIKGVGVVAGGPYYCAQASTGEGVISFGTGAMLEAAGPCMTGPLNDISALIKQAQSNGASGAVDATSNIGHQKIYVFHGYNDNVVARSVTDATVKFYRHYLDDKAEGNLFYQSAIGAGHSFVTLDEAKKGLDSCATNQSPYINQCGYDQAGILLQHIYGELNPPTLGPLTGTLKNFDQSLYTGNDIPGALSLADQGFVFVPKDCAQGAACRVHIALHGCAQDVGTVGKKFVELAGYNRWADANHIVVLYPQTTASPFAPFNPQSCWDWWGYVTGSNSYVTKSGKQIAAIKAMLDALTVQTGRGAGCAGCAAQPDSERSRRHVGGAGLDGRARRDLISRVAGRVRRFVPGHCGDRRPEFCRWRPCRRHDLYVAGRPAGQRGGASAVQQRQSLDPADASPLQCAGLLSLAQMTEARVRDNPRP